jgi:hypothetical protein
MSIFDTSLLDLASKAHGSVWGDIKGYRDTYQKQLTEAAKQKGPGDQMFGNIGMGLAGALPGMIEGLGGLGGLLGGLFGGGAPMGVQALPWQGGADAGGWAQTQSGQNIFGASGAPMLPFQSVQSFVGQ